MYEEYNLKTNPFTDTKQDYPMLNRVVLDKNLKKILSSYIGSKNPAIVPIVGEYGVGKTFYLMKICEKINNETFF